VTSALREKAMDLSSDINCSLTEDFYIVFNVP